MTDHADTNTGTQQESTRYQGLVKWFNNRLGYGFIKVVDNTDRRHQDIFVHQSRVTPLKSEYRTLRKGEYVSFDVCPDQKNTWQADRVTGIHDGPLLCDTNLRPRNPDQDQVSNDPEESNSSV